MKFFRKQIEKGWGARLIENLEIKRIMVTVMSNVTKKEEGAPPLPIPMPVRYVKCS